MSRQDEVGAKLDRILHRLIVHYDAVARAKTPPNKTDFAKAKAALLQLLRDREAEARLSEWDWIKEHSYANEADVNYQLLDKDEAEGRIAELKANQQGATHE